MSYLRNTVGALLASVALASTAMGGELERNLGFPLNEENAVTKQEKALVQKANQKFNSLEQQEKLLDFYKKCVKDANLTDSKYQMGILRGEEKVETLRNQVQNYAFLVPEYTKQLSQK